MVLVRGVLVVTTELEIILLWTKDTPDDATHFAVVNIFFADETFDETMLEVLTLEADGIAGLPNIASSSL